MLVCSGRLARGSMVQFGAAMDGPGLTFGLVCPSKKEAPHQASGSEKVTAGVNWLWQPQGNARHGDSNSKQFLEILEGFVPCQWMSL